MGGYNFQILLLIFERYMNTTTPRGYFRQPGSIHLHVDGGVQYEPVRQTLSTYGGKIQKILHVASGPQRSQLPEVYRGHTPGSLEQEAFEFFSTTPITSQDQAVKAVMAIYPQLVHHPNIIIELERVVLAGSSISKNWKEVNLNTVQPLTVEEVPYLQAQTLPIEIHHGINISKCTERAMPPLHLSSLLSISKEVGLEVGGWFLFEKENKWAFRSNEFTERDGYQLRAKNQHDALRGVLQKLGLEYELWTIAEQVLGLWRVENDETFK